MPLSFCVWSLPSEQEKLSTLLSVKKGMFISSGGDGADLCAIAHCAIMRSTFSGGCPLLESACSFVRCDAMRCSAVFYVMTAVLYLLYCTVLYCACFLVAL